MPTFDFAPLFWWGLPLAAAPLVIHLITQLRQQRVRWAAMEFLLASQRRHRTQILLRQILLLAVRTLAVLGLVAALAGPRWRPAGRVPGASAAHLVILDDSGSMADSSGSGDRVAEIVAGDTRRATAFDRGRRVVERLAADLAASAAGQRLAVILSSQAARAASEAEPACLVPLTAVTPAAMQAIRDALARAAVGEGAAGLREGSAAAAALLAEAGPGSRVLWLVGDFRARDWPAVDESTATLRRLASDGVEVRLVDCALDATAANVTVERLEVVGGVPAVDVPLPVEVAIRNDGPAAVRDVMVAIREDGGGRPGLRIDEIPADTTVTRRFDVRFTTPGSHAIEVALPADVLPPDDVRRATIDVADVVDVLVVDGGLDSAATAAADGGDGFFVATALAPGRGVATGLRPRVVSPAALAGLDLTRFSSLWLLDCERLDQAAVAAVEAHVRAGGGVVFFCGPRTRAEFVNATLHRDGAGVFPVPLAAAVDLLEDAASVPPPPDVTAADHPVVAVLRGQRNPLLDAVRIRRFWAVDRGFDPAAHGVRRMLSLRSGPPLAVEKAFGAGRSVAVLTTAAPEWNTWARANPSWVVVLLELEGHLGRLRRRAESTAVGAALTVRLEAGVDEPEVEFLVPPDATPVRQAAVPVSGPVLEARLADTARAGLYSARWRTLAGGERERILAVTIDPGEGRLERAGRRRLDAALPGVPFRYDAAGDLDAAGGDPAGWGLAAPLLAAVAALLVVEQFIAYAAGYHPVTRRTPA